MTKLEETLAALKASGEGAFMPFFVAGDPDFDTSLALFDAIAGAADIIELGFPFSDPPADGPVIQAADVRALNAGMNTERSFELVERVHERAQKPIALLVYYNLILSHGVDAFYGRAKGAGVDAILVADVPLEEADEILAASKKHDVHPIFIVSENTTEKRLDAILEKASGYLYLVAHVGVTGAREHTSSALKDIIAKLKAKTTLPVLAGFGISTPEHVKSVLNAGADGAIVGSALVRLIEHADDPTMLAKVRTLATDLKAATNR